jgi:hypothetical protein
MRSLLDILMMRNNAHGGRRAGAGRPPLTTLRCHCGKHTMARAERLRLKCRRAGDRAQKPA